MDLPVNSPSATQLPLKAKDPVCGMDVNPANARFKALHNEKQYFFCSAGCVAKFQANPEKILSFPPKPMGAGLVSLGGRTVPPKPHIPPGTRPGPAVPEKDTRAYICPMCP